MGTVGDIVGQISSGLGLDLVKGKFASDLDQKSAREAAEKNRDISVEMFGMQKASNLEQWEREKAYNLDLWNRNNEYNTPAAQMNRLKEAGLNPRLMYGEGTVGNATPPSVAQLETPELSTPSMETTKFQLPHRQAMDYMSIKQAGLENQNLSAQNSLILANTDKVRAEADAVRREYNLDVESGTSSKDSPMIRYMMRHGGRIGRGVQRMGKEKVLPMFEGLFDKVRGFTRDQFLPFMMNKTYK